MLYRLLLETARLCKPLIVSKWARFTRLEVVRGKPSSATKGFQRPGAFGGGSVDVTGTANLYSKAPRKDAQQTFIPHWPLGSFLEPLHAC